MLQIIIANWDAVAAIGTACWTLYLQITKETKPKRSRMAIRKGKN